MKKLMITMMVMTMTIVGTITAYGSTNTDKHPRVTHNMRTDKMHGRSHFMTRDRHETTKFMPHTHAFNRHDICVKCDMSKKEINDMKRTARKDMKKPCPPCKRNDKKMHK